MTDDAPVWAREAAAPGALFRDPRRCADIDEWHGRVRELRRTVGVVHVDEPGYEPYWALLRHADVSAVSRDNAGWLNTPRVVLSPDSVWDAFVGSGMPMPASLVQLDGKRHRDHRAITSGWFKPSAVKERSPRVDELCDLFVQRMRDLGGTCDFAKDIAQPYTLRVIMDIYGVPAEDEPLMLELTQGVFGAADPEFMGDAADPQARMMSSIARFVEYFNEITLDRRGCPRDDLASLIANGQVDGGLIGDVERIWYFITLATAGHDTTSFALSGGMERFANQPEQLWALRDDPEIIPNAADEIIRYTSPVRHFLRYAAHDQRIGGVDIPEGARVLLSYPSANRDEDVFSDPDTFDVRRPDADKLISFGMGAHFCLGSNVARRELRAMLERLSQQLEHVELAGPVEYAEAHLVSGVKHLPLEYRFR